MARDCPKKEKSGGGVKKEEKAAGFIIKQSVRPFIKINLLNLQKGYKTLASPYSFSDEKPSLRNEKEQEVYNPYDDDTDDEDY